MKYCMFVFIMVIFLGSCGFWKEKSGNSEPVAEEPVMVRAIPALYIHTGPEFSRQSLLEPLIAEYGRIGSGGLLSVFASVQDLDEIPFSSVILTIGADSGIIRPLSRLAEQRRDLRIISLFSLEEPVLLEYFSEIVLDVALSDALLTPESETRGLPVNDRELSLLMVALVRSLEFRDWNKTRSGQLYEQLDELFREDDINGVPATWSIQPYTDPESGIRSRNHLQLQVRERT